MGTDRFEVVVATGNPDKAAEWAAMLADSPFELVAWDGPSPEEDADDYEGNARIKAVSARRTSSLAVIGDDSGIEVEALDGEPGLFTKQWAEDRGGFPEARRELARVALNSPVVYHCGLAWADEHRVLTALGSTTGRVAEPVDPGAGFEPSFVPVGASRSLAAMNDEERHHFHPRMRAWRALLSKLTE